MITDLPVEDAERVAREFEDELDAIDQVEFEHPRTPTEPTTIVVFSTASDFHAFFPRLVEGEFRRALPGDLEPSRYVVLHGAVSAETRTTCVHEMTHDLFARNFGPAPPWLNEGWAQYYSTIEVLPDKLRVGGALPHLTFTFSGAAFNGRTTDGSYMLAMPIDDVPPPSQLLAMDSKQFYAFSKEREVDTPDHLKGIATYMGAWALVHMLHDGPEAYQVRYRRFLEKVRDSQVQAAWQSAFGDIDAASFDRDFRRYLGAQEVTLFEYPRHKTEAGLRFTRRALPDAEVRILWARLSPANPEQEQAALQDLNAAVREAPTAPEGHYYRGLYWLHRKQLASAEPDFVEAVRLAPSDPRYLLALAILRIEQSSKSSRGHAGDPVMQVAQPLAAAATSAVQFQQLSYIYDELGEHEQALVFARRATQLSPIDSGCLDAEARALSSLGRNQEALSIQRAAVAFLPEGAHAPDFLKRLEIYEERARSAQ